MKTGKINYRFVPFSTFLMATNGATLVTIPILPVHGNRDQSAYINPETTSRADFEVM